jgi:uncharacterized protein related to proFAR isomerase
MYTHQQSHHINEGNLEGIDDEDQNEEVSVNGGVNRDAEDLEHSLLVQDTDDLGSETSEADGDREEDNVSDTELYAAM